MDRGARIKALRVAKGWKQPDLASAVRAQGAFESPSYLSKIETGQAGAVSVTTLEAVAAALELPSEAILTSAHDQEIERDPIAFLRRHSLERTVAKHAIAPEEAEALRDVERSLQKGPVSVEGWEVLRTYGLAYRDARRKPGAKSDSRSALHRLRRASRRRATR